MDENSAEGLISFVKCYNRGCSDPCFLAKRIRIRRFFCKFRNFFDFVLRITIKLKFSVVLKLNIVKPNKFPKYDNLDATAISLQENVQFL